jgi:hypothetical protein
MTFRLLRASRGYPTSRARQKTCVFGSPSLPAAGKSTGAAGSTAARFESGKSRGFSLDHRRAPLRYFRACRNKKVEKGACVLLTTAHSWVAWSPRQGPEIPWIAGTAVTSFLISAAALLVLLGLGIAIIVKVRAWTGESSDNPDRWETTLADYRNLRNKGVLSEEEYRKIRTLVEPDGRGSVSSLGGEATKALLQRGGVEEHHDNGEQAPPTAAGDLDEDYRSSGEDAPPA